MAVEAWEIRGVFGDLQKLRSLTPRRDYRASFEAYCPAHDDESSSLTIDITHDGCILLHCFSGCSVNEICNVCDIDVRDLVPVFPYKGKYKTNKPYPEPTRDCRFISSIQKKIKTGNFLSTQEQNLYLQASKREAMRQC